MLTELSSLRKRAKTIETSLSNYISENKELLQKLTQAENELLTLSKVDQELQNENGFTAKKLEEVKQDKVVQQVKLKEAN